MSTIDTVIGLLEPALNEAYLVKGTASPMDQVTVLKAQVVTLTTANTAANTKIAAMQKAIDDAQLNLGPF